MTRFEKINAIRMNMIDEIRKRFFPKADDAFVIGKKNAWFDYLTPSGGHFVAIAFDHYGLYFNNGVKVLWNEVVDMMLLAYTIDYLEKVYPKECQHPYENPDEPKPENKEFHVLLGTEAVRIIDEDDIDELIRRLEKEPIGYEIFHYTGNPVELLSASRGFEDYIILSEEDYAKFPESQS